MANLVGMKHNMFFMRYPGGRAKALTYTFDDGSDQDIWLVEKLKKYGMKATFNVNMGLIPDTEDFDFDSTDPGVFPVRKVQRRLTYNAMEKLFKDSGMELATHGFLHAELPRLDDAAVMYEILQDRIAIEKLMGEPIFGHAYAQGAYNDRVCELLRHAGIVYARTAGFTHDFSLPEDFMKWGPSVCYYDKDAMELAEKFVNFKPGPCLYYDETRPKLFNVFAHSYEMEFWDNYDKMEALMEKLAGHDDIWYCTNIEFYRCVEAYNRLEYNVERTLVRNPSAIPVWIYANGKNVEILPGEVKEL